MLNRSLFEDMIDLHWIEADSETAEQRYRDHFHHSQMLLADAVAKHPEHYADLALPDFDPAKREALDNVYGKWGSKPWSGINLYERVSLVEDQWKDEAGRRILHFFHDIAHRENNQTLHVSSVGIDANTELSTGGALTFRVGPRPDMVDKALFGSFWIFDNSVGLIVDRFEIEVDEKTRQHLFSAKDFVNLSAEQIRETGRNDPCPCGSGLKFKRCHGA
jgi:hypothetical protein